MKYDVIIIGGGAAGLMAAVTAARKGRKVLLLEKNKKLGRKINATGNGKCNFTNEYQARECYRSKTASLAWDIVSRFDKEHTIVFFEGLGILPKEKDGYYYPNSEQAASVTEVFAMEIGQLGVICSYEQTVTDIRKKADDFLVTTETEVFMGGKVILAAGGCASPVHGSDGSGYALAKKMGHKVTKLFPALVQLKAAGNYFKTLAGIRLEGYGRLMAEGTLVAEEYGEFLFADYGISGIPILQMSRFVAQSLDNGKKVTLSLDFFPKLKENELNEIIKKRVWAENGRTIEEAFTGVLNRKLVYIILKDLHWNAERAARELNEKDIRRLSYRLKNFTMDITGTKGFEHAQVTAGGISLNEVNPATMESYCTPGLFLAGEILDVDGTCGGYNLQWAWSSGFLAGDSV